MKSGLKRGLQIIIVVISISVFGKYLIDFDYTVLSLLAPAMWFYILGIWVLTFFVFQIGSLFLFKSFGENVTLIEVTLLNLSTTVSNYATPVKIGFPLQIYLMKKMMGIPYTKCTTMVFVNLLASYGISFLLSIIGAFYLTAVVLPKATFSTITVLMIAVAISIVAALFLIKRLGSNLTIINKILTKLSEAKEYIRQINLIYLSLLIFVIFLGFFLSSWMQYEIIKTMGVPISIIALFSIQGIPFLLGSLSMLPMGLGVKDASLVFLLVKLGTSSTIAVTTALITRVLVTGLSVSLGLLAINYLISKGLFTHSS